MPIGEEYASAFVVQVEGRALRPEVRDRLVHGYVDDSVHVPSMFVLRFSDPDGRVLTDLGVTIGGRVSVAVKQSSTGGPVELIDGDVTALEQEIDERGSFLTVRGLDLRYRLQSGAGTRAYSAMSVADIVRKVVHERGGRAQVTVTGPRFDHLAQDRESDWEFLCRLARATGSVMRMEGRTLHFGPPARAAASPGTDPTTDALVIARGENLISLRATLTGSTQVPEVEARGWNPTAKSAIVETGQTRTVAAVLGSTPTDLATKVHGTTHVVGRLGTPQTITQLATTTAAARAGAFAEVEGVVRGNPRLHAGTPVHLAGLGASFAGKYVLTDVRHDIDPVDGFRTTFTAADTSDRSVYGVISGGSSAPGGPEPHGGVLVAVVTNVKDPDGLGRVKIKLPTLSGDYESWWARTMQLGAGNVRGASWLPEVGDEVLLAFGQGSLDEPYVLGGLYNGVDKAGKGWAAHVAGDGTIKRRALTSRTGMIVEFLEDAQTSTLTVSTNDGAQHLTLTQSADKGIVLVSQGALEVTAEQDITITGKQDITATTATGDFSVSAANVSLEATSALKLKGATLAAEGSGTAELTGANVKVAGQAGAELSASAVTTVRGAMVKIN